MDSRASAEEAARPLLAAAHDVALSDLDAGSSGRDRRKPTGYESPGEGLRGDASCGKAAAPRRVGEGVESTSGTSWFSRRVRRWVLLCVMGCSAAVVMHSVKRSVDARHSLDPVARKLLLAQSYTRDTNLETSSTFSPAPPPPAEQFRLVTELLKPQYTPGELLLARVLGPEPTMFNRTWLRLQMTSTDDGGIRSAGIPMSDAANGWVVPLVKPGNYALSVRLVVFDLPDALEHYDVRTHLVRGQPTPEWAKCFNDTIINGDYTFEVQGTASDSPYSELRRNIAALPDSVRTPRMDTIGTLDGQSCWSTTHSLDGYWQQVAKSTVFYPFSGCTPIKVGPESVKKTIAELPKTSMKWIRMFGDSNSRNIIKMGFPWDAMPIPAGTYPVELVEGGTHPCLFGFNPTSGKDEEFLCVLNFADRPPILLTLEWFTMSFVTSKSILEVQNRTLHEAFAAAYNNVTLLNKYWHIRHYDEAYNVTHTIDTFLAPWPELRDVKYADHTVLSFGSHRIELASQAWTETLESFLTSWPKSRHAQQPLRNQLEDLTFVYTTATNSALIPAKFATQHTARNNLRIRARNAHIHRLLDSHSLLAPPGMVSKTGDDSPTAYEIDFYGTTLPMLEVMHDAVHFYPYLYSVHSQLLLQHVFERRARREHELGIEPR